MDFCLYDQPLKWATRVHASRKSTQSWFLAILRFWWTDEALIFVAWVECLYRDHLTQIFLPLMVLFYFSRFHKRDNFWVNLEDILQKWRQARGTSPALSSSSSTSTSTPSTTCEGSGATPSGPDTSLTTARARSGSGLPLTYGATLPRTSKSDRAGSGTSSRCSRGCRSSTTTTRPWRPTWGTSAPSTPTWRPSTPSDSPSRVANSGSWWCPGEYFLSRL